MKSDKVMSSDISQTFPVQAHREEKKDHEMKDLVRLLVSGYDVWGEAQVGGC